MGLNPAEEMHFVALQESFRVPCWRDQMKATEGEPSNTGSRSVRNS